MDGEDTAGYSRTDRQRTGKRVDRADCADRVKMAAETGVVRCVRLRGRDGIGAGIQGGLRERHGYGEYSGRREQGG